MAHPYWPLFDLVVRTPRLELRVVTDEMAPELARIAGMDMFAGDGSQFSLPWLDAPSPRRERSSLQFWWRHRAELTADSWDLDFAVLVGGRPVGSQAMHAVSFPQLRTVTTGSWLAAPHQGKGLGTEMRQAVLHLAFCGLGAVEAYSGAFETNLRSIAVSRRCGYVENGSALGLRAGQEAARHINFVLTAERYRETMRTDIVIEGLEACRDLLGVATER